MIVRGYPYDETETTRCFETNKKDSTVGVSIFTYFHHWNERKVLTHLLSSIVQDLGSSSSGSIGAIASIRVEAEIHLVISLVFFTCDLNKWSDPFKIFILMS